MGTAGQAGCLVIMNLSWRHLEAFEARSICAVQKVSAGDGEAPDIFFVDSDHGRGHVLYRRFDGHYGMIVSSDE
jgi:hypothetical protein